MPRLYHLALKKQPKKTKKQKKLQCTGAVDGVKPEGVVLYRMKETLRHMRIYLNTLHPMRFPIFLGIP